MTQLCICTAASCAVLVCAVLLCASLCPLRREQVLQPGNAITRSTEPSARTTERSETAPSRPRLAPLGGAHAPGYQEPSRQVSTLRPLGWSLVRESHLENQA